MNDIIVKQFSLDIDRNTRDIANLTKQLKKMKRKNFIFGALAVGAIVYAYMLDKYIEEELSKIKDTDDDISIS